jgi:CheY-like chemotaxis protein
VLIVEDDDAVARLYDRALRNPDYDLYRAASGEEALSLWAETPFDAIVNLRETVARALDGNDPTRNFPRDRQPAIEGERNDESAAS